MPLTLEQKLEILADAAKYDASCASSGGAKRNARSGGIGSVTGAGICHAYTPDGRCVSLLKILLTNFCIFDCAYCVSRRSSNVRRARFSVDEVVKLTLDLYRRNCIEGLFLSSGIARSEDDTMADLVRVAKSLRDDHAFRGYIHLKTIPGASEALIAQAGRYADRLSMNVELPTDTALRDFAPEKTASSIRKGLATTRLHIESAKDSGPGPGRRTPGRSDSDIPLHRTPRPRPQEDWPAHPFLQRTAEAAKTRARAPAENRRAAARPHPRPSGRHRPAGRPRQTPRPLDRKAQGQRPSASGRLRLPENPRHQPQAAPA